jgi:hypothetical protein
MSNVTSHFVSLHPERITSLTSVKHSHENRYAGLRARRVWHEAAANS